MILVDIFIELFVSLIVGLRVDLKTFLTFLGCLGTKLQPPTLWCQFSASNVSEDHGSTVTRSANGSRVYLDIFIVGCSEEEHVVVLEQMLSQFQGTGLSLQQKSVNSV